TNQTSFLDDVAGSPVVAGTSNYWYTIRAVSQAACDALLSPQSAPAWGVLRERSAPDPTTGSVNGSCGTPVVMFQNFNTLTNPPDTNTVYYRFTCLRRDRGIAWVQFFVTNSGSAVGLLGPIYFPPGGDAAQVDFTWPNRSDETEFDIGCMVGTYYGAT